MNAEDIREFIERKNPSLQWMAKEMKVSPRHLIRIKHGRIRSVRPETLRRFSVLLGRITFGLPVVTGDKAMEGARLRRCGSGKSGTPGVYWHGPTQKWHVRGPIRSGKSKSFGYYDDLEIARERARKLWA